MLGGLRVIERRHEPCSIPGQGGKHAMSLRDTVRSSMERALARALIGWERVRTGVAFDPFDPKLHADPSPIYRRLRESDPMHRSYLVRGWVLSRYDDVFEALHHPMLSSDERNEAGYAKAEARMRRLGLIEEGGGIARSMLRLDPPDHTRLRRLVSKAFTPRAVARLEAGLRTIVEEHLDRAAQSGGMDVIRDLATPLPVIAIAELIGVPREDRERFKHWSDEIALSVGFSGVAEARRTMRAGRELRAYFDHGLAERRASPRDDLMSSLLEAEDAGDRLSHAELLSTLELLLVAGNETTTNLIGNGLLALLRHPDQLELLQREPERLPVAIEELIRFDGPVQATSRIALEDLDLAGETVRRGQSLIVLLGAANHDPERFEDPDRLDVTRAENPHLGFGHGVHFCLGASLARLETRLALGALIERFPGIKLATERLRWRSNPILHGLESLPVRL
jgi:hypothetical protein